VIAYLKGTLTERAPTRIVVDVGGVGYEVLVPLSTSDAMPETGKDVKLLTYHHVREDADSLFGFATPAEREVFEILLTVKGIGPKVALGILSGTSVERFKQAVAAGDSDTLATIPGIGKKTSQRIVMELAEKFGPPLGPLEALAARALPTEAVQAVEALVRLGVLPQKAKVAVEAVLQKTRGRGGLAVEEVVRRALAEV
jgi:Holliday junction DNA helicase RuvA